MARVRIGLDIGSTGVRAAELSMRSSPPALARVGQVPLPQDAVSSGEVRDPEAVTAALRELWHRGKFRSKEVVLGVANQRVVVREVVLPWLEEKEFRESLPFQVQEYVPIPLEDAVLDYTVLEELDREGRRMVRLLVVAAQKGMVQQLIQTVDAAKLRPAGLDLIPFAIVRSVGSVEGLGLEGTIEGGEEAVVDVGADVTSICVHATGIPRFVRILSSAGREVTSAISRGVGVNPEEAERLKTTVPDAMATPEDTAVADQARKAALTMAGGFADEIRSSLDFYLSQTPGAKIGRVLLTGGGSRLNGLLELLSERLPARVEGGHAFRRVRPALDLPAETLEEAEPLLAVAIGLALPGGLV